MQLPTDAKQRKSIPIATGCIDYFPLALAAVAELSRKGNDQHNPGKPLFWDRSKSQDEADALMRHFIDRGKLDVDGSRHSVKVAWRALALLQKELEAEQKLANVVNDARDRCVVQQAQQQAAQADYQKVKDRLNRGLPPHEKPPLNEDGYLPIRSGYTDRT